MAERLVCFPSGNQDRFGSAIVVADFNGDGLDDIVAGAPRAGIGGQICLYEATGGGVLEPTDVLDGRNCDINRGFGDRFGSALTAGDFNNDGDVDLAVGIPRRGVLNRGAVCILPNTATGFALGAIFNDPAGPDALQNRARLGESLASGDFDCDDFDDLAVGSPRRRVDGVRQTGAVYIYTGVAAGDTAPFPFADAGRLVQTFFGASNERLDRFGTTLISGVNFNGDSLGGLPCEDLAIGAPFEDVAVKTPTGIENRRNSGAVFWALGAPGVPPFSMGSFELQRPPAVNERNDRFGFSLAVGLVDEDGFGDLLVGTLREDDEGATNTGVVFAFFGAPNGLGPKTQILLQRGFGFLEAGANEDNDRFGRSLVGGDFDGDGFTDIAIASPLDDHLTGELERTTIPLVPILPILSEERVGLVYMRYSNGDLFGRSANDYILSMEDVAVESAGDRMGWKAMGAGDFNGDGIDDLVVGVPFMDFPDTNNGNLFVALSDASELQDPALCPFPDWSGTYEGMAFACDPNLFIAGMPCDITDPAQLVVPDPMDEPNAFDPAMVRIEVEQNGCAALRGFLYALEDFETDTGFVVAGMCNEYETDDAEIDASTGECDKIDFNGAIDAVDPNLSVGIGALDAVMMNFVAERNPAMPDDLRITVTPFDPVCALIIAELTRIDPIPEVPACSGVYEAPPECIELSELPVSEDGDAFRPPPASPTGAGSEEDDDVGAGDLDVPFDEHMCV